jgi:hypothetical protein
MTDVELTRQQWDDGNRRIEATRGDDARYGQLTAQVDVVVSALRRRVGQIFTLAELAEVYEGADDWAREQLDDADPDGRPATEVGTITDGAFHVYARGASDYAP